MNAKTVSELNHTMINAADGGDFEKFKACKEWLPEQA